jgi:hypothetical protein
MILIFPSQSDYHKNFPKKAEEKVKNPLKLNQTCPQATGQTTSVHPTKLTGSAASADRARGLLPQHTSPFR